MPVHLFTLFNPSVHQVAFQKLLVLPEKRLLRRIITTSVINFGFGATCSGNTTAGALLSTKSPLWWAPNGGNVHMGLYVVG